MSVYDDYEMTIGIECHVQLKTKTKLFSTSDNDAKGKAPNTTINHIDWSIPGMLPVLNKQAVVLATRAAKALNAKVNLVSRFDRKHYFYPDLPKGYQISQLYQPIIGAGQIEVEIDGERSVVRIEHAHLEEDAGKLTHGLGSSYVDLNRSGTPLIEIVSMPDIHSAKQARAYAQELHRLMVFSDVTIGDLYEGNMRFDVNISVAKKGAKELGTRAEVKNLNSFKSVEKAAEYEFKRQIDLLESGQKVVQETRGYEDATGRTFSQRSKEEAKDYRYMPDPDIPPIVLTDHQVEQMQAGMPLLPPAYRLKWQPLQFDESVENSLLASPDYARTVTDILDQTDAKTAKIVANWLVSATSEPVKAEFDSDLTKKLIDLAQMFIQSQLNSTNAKLIFNQLLTDNVDPDEYAKEHNLIQVSDDSALEQMLDQILLSDQGKQAIQDIESGNPKAAGFIVGQVMKLSKGQANPQIIKQILDNKIKEH